MHQAPKTTASDTEMTPSKDAAQKPAAIEQNGTIIDHSNDDDGGSDSDNANTPQKGTQPAV